MGYSTDFSGKLTFKCTMDEAKFTKLNSFLGEDCREHPEWNSDNLTWIDLEVTKDLTGLEWDGSEKTYDLTEKVNLIITEMKKDFPDFELDGYLKAQGEDMDDRCVLKIENGFAKTIDLIDKF